MVCPFCLEEEGEDSNGDDGTEGQAGTSLETEDADVVIIEGATILAGGADSSRGALSAVNSAAEGGGGVGGVSDLSSWAASAWSSKVGTLFATILASSALLESVTIFNIAGESGLAG